MSTLNQLREGFSRAWDSLAEGWRELRERAGDALTRFQPSASRGNLETVEDHVASRGARWGVLAAEVTDDGDKIQVMLEAPGLDPGDFQLEVHEDILVIRGEKRVSREETRGRYYVMERAYGHFERAIRLPAPVDEESAQAIYRAGVLSVTLPKTAASRSRRIQVNTD